MKYTYKNRAKVVMKVIATVGLIAEYIPISLRELAERAELSKRTVQRALNDLKTAKAVTVHFRRGRPLVVTLHKDGTPHVES